MNNNQAQDSKNIDGIESNNDSKNQSTNNTINNIDDKPKLQSILIGINGLSLGISIVVALLVGVGIGILLKNIFNVFWVFWIGVFWGVAAAILNVYKAYKSQLKEFENMANDPKYSYQANNKDSD